MTRQDKTRHDNTTQNKIKQNKTKQNKTKQNKQNKKQCSNIPIPMRDCTFPYDIFSRNDLSNDLCVD